MLKLKFELAKIGSENLVVWHIPIKCAIGVAHKIFFADENKSITI